jgi:hypothetical protein
MHYYPTNTNSNQRGTFLCRKNHAGFKNQRKETVDYYSVSNKDAYQSQLFPETTEQS